MLFLCLLLALAVLILYALKFTEGGLDNIFVPGSLWKVAAIIAAFAIAYPMVGFRTRHLVIPGSYEELRPSVIEVLKAQGYELRGEKPGESMTFRARSPLRRFLCYFGEERILLTKTGMGFDMEGHVRHITPAASALEYRFRDSQ